MYLIYIGTITTDIVFIDSFVTKNILCRYKRFRIANYGSVMLIEDKKWLKKLALPLPLLLVLGLGVFLVRQYHRQTKECCSMEVHLLMLSFRKASMNDTHISVECSAPAYISPNTAAKAINMSMVYAAVPDAPHIKTEAVTFVTGKQKKKLNIWR